MYNVLQVQEPYGAATGFEATCLDIRPCSKYGPVVDMLTKWYTHI